MKVDGKWLIQETGYLRVYEEMWQRGSSHRIRTNMHQPKSKKTSKR